MWIVFSFLKFSLFQQHSLATDLQNLSLELRKRQSTYLKRLRQQKEVCIFSKYILVSYIINKYEL